MILVWYYLRANRLYQSKGIISDALSVVWTERYQDYGEAEIILPLGYDVALDDVLAIPDRDMIVIVTGSLETEESITVYAKDILSVLDRRIVYPTVYNNGSISTFVDKLLRNDGVILDSGNNSRTLQPFRVGDLTAITGTANIQRTYGQIGETLLNLGRVYGFQPKTVMNDGLIYITATSTVESRVWGVGRYLAGYQISKDTADYRNVAYTGGQIVNGSRVVTVSGSGSGMNRYELFVDRRDLPYEEMDFDAVSENYGAPVRPLGALRIYTVTEGSASLYRVTDFEAEVFYALDNGFVCKVIIDSLRNILTDSDFNTLVTNADNTVKVRLYTITGYSDGVWNVTIGSGTVSLSADDLLAGGVYSLTVNEYQTALENKGTDALADASVVNLIEVAIEGLSPYTDYDLGDTVTVVSGTGVNYVGTVKEIIESWDDSGYQVTPTIDFE